MADRTVRPEVFTVALFADLNHTYGRKILAGVAAYARTRRQWAVEPVAAKVRGGEEILAHSKASGLIVQAASREIAEVVARTGKSAINVSGRLDSSPFPRVTVSNRRVGEIAAKYLMELGVESYAFVQSHDRPNHNFEQRKKAFVAALAKENFSCRIFGEDAKGEPQRIGNEDIPRLATWLRALPRQTGILADSDDMAGRIVTTCRIAGIHVPNELLVMGVDHDELQSIASGALLTSVDVNPTAIGYEAAKLLDRMMSGEKVAPSAEVEVEPVGVITGTTTDFVVCGDEYIGKILVHIRDHANRPILVDELADLVPLSRRALEIRFKRIVGRSPNAEIRRIRIERVKDLLAYTELPVSTIALDMGFGEVKNLSTAFRKETGVTPTEFRRRCQPAARDSVMAGARQSS